LSLIRYNRREQKITSHPGSGPGVRKYARIPELLEQFMQEQGTDERWSTVQELRDRVGLTRSRCNTVSGFLRRLEFGSLGPVPSIVMRLER
jgi:hypothetical protein